MRISTARRACGFATFEAAMIVTAVFGIGLIALGLVDYFNRTDASFRALDRALHNSNVKPLSIATDPNGGFRLAVDETGLRAFIDQVVSELPGERGEAGFSELDIDERTGALLGVRPVSYRAVRGAPPSATQNCPGLSEELLRFSEPGAGIPSPLAIPNLGGRGGFLPKTVVIAARAAAEVGGNSLTAAALHTWGHPALVTVCSVTVARGEISAG